LSFQRHFDFHHASTPSRHVRQLRRDMASFQFSLEITIFFAVMPIAGSAASATPPAASHAGRQPMRAHAPARVAPLFSRHAVFAFPRATMPLSLMPLSRCFVVARLFVFLPSRDAAAFIISPPRIFSSRHAFADAASHAIFAIRCRHRHQADHDYFAPGFSSFSMVAFRRHRDTPLSP